MFVELLVLTYDFKHDFNEYLRTEVASSHSLPIPSVYSYSTTPDNVSDAAQERRKIASLKDVIQYNEEHPTPEGYNQELLIMSEATDGIHNETYIKARDANRDAARQVLDSVLLMHNLDAVVSPSESRYDGILDEDLKDSSVLGYSLAAIAGYPSINVSGKNGGKWKCYPTSLYSLHYHAVHMKPLRRVSPPLLVDFEKVSHLISSLLSASTSLKMFAVKQANRFTSDILYSCMHAPPLALGES